MGIDNKTNIEHELVKRIKLADDVAFKELCRIYYEPIYRFLWRKIRDENTALDLVQQLFLNIWKTRESLDETRILKPYIYQSANNLAINHLKQKARRQKYFIDNNTAESVSQADSNQEFQEYVDDVLYDLPETQRSVFILNKFEGFKYAEIAAMLNVSVKTVESRMSKALKTLRHKLHHLLCICIFFYF